MQAVPIQESPVTQTHVLTGWSCQMATTIAATGMPQYKTKLRTLFSESVSKSLSAKPVYPAQQLSLATSWSKVWAANFNPSTVVR